MVRDAPTPFVVLADDCLKGGEDVHEYTWAMAVDHDVEILSFDGEDVFLGETGPENNRRFVLRLLTACGEGEISSNMKHYSKDSPRKKLPDGSFEQIPAYRVTLRTTGVNAHFYIAFFPLEFEESVPPATTSTDRNHLVVKSPAASGKPAAVQVIEYGVTAGTHGETLMTVVSSERSFPC